MVSAILTRPSRRCELSLSVPRAGCNFSAISGSDANALRWDKLGYSHLSKLASERPEETFVRRTESIELWDEDVPHHKIKEMSEYLEDVCQCDSNQANTVGTVF